mmetsp:Transcript_2655/g.9243  ORF Transcript_2655/g.9243 Transcript_2655/m.9243 type:complete len:118 (-) Transcript_2655:168-521(-)
MPRVVAEQPIPDTEGVPLSLQSLSAAHADNGGDCGAGGGGEGEGGGGSAVHRPISGGEAGGGGSRGGGGDTGGRRGGDIGGGRDGHVSYRPNPQKRQPCWPPAAQPAGLSAVVQRAS